MWKFLSLCPALLSMSFKICGWKGWKITVLVTKVTAEMVSGSIQGKEHIYKLSKKSKQFIQDMQVSSTPIYLRNGILNTMILSSMVFVSTHMLWFFLMLYFTGARHIYIHIYISIKPIKSLSHSPWVMRQAQCTNKKTTIYLLHGAFISQYALWQWHYHSCKVCVYISHYISTAIFTGDRCAWQLSRDQYPRLQHGYRTVLKQRA